MKTKIIRKKKVSGLKFKVYKGRNSKLKNGKKLNRYSKKIQKGGSGGVGVATVKNSYFSIPTLIGYINNPKNSINNTEGFTLVSGKNINPLEKLKEELKYLYQCKNLKNLDKKLDKNSSFYKYKCCYENCGIEKKTKLEVLANSKTQTPKKTQFKTSSNPFALLDTSTNTNNESEAEMEEEQDELEEEETEDDDEGYDKNTSYKKDTILYVNKKTGETYSVYERTNQNIGVEYNKNKSYKEKGIFFDITPIELSVDTIQLAINTGCLEIMPPKPGSKNNNTYLGFKTSDSGINFPSLSVKQRDSSSGFSYSSREHAEWISVYEQEFDKDAKFELIETQDGRHIDKNTFDIEIKSLDEKIKYTRDEEEKSYLESQKPVVKEKSNLSNEELFIMKQNEMRTLFQPGTEEDKNKNKDKIGSQVKYRAYVSLEDEYNNNDIKYEESIFKSFNTNKNTNNIPKPNQYVTSENIEWVMYNSLWLERYLEEFKKGNITDDTKAADLNILIGEKYKCDDLSGLDAKYIIVDEFKNDGEGCDGLEYVICGYPDKKMKEVILNFWQNENMKIELDKVHENHKDNLGNLLVDFYNSNKEYKDVFPDTILENYFKLYYKVREEDWQYIFNYFAKKYETTNDEKYKDFENKFKILYADYYNKIAKLYLNKPNLNIKYIFLIFKNEQNKLIPLIYNFKELDIKYKSFLEKINIFIKKNISKIFNIISMENYLSDDTDINEYKLYYSYYKYGTFFNIKTEYLHNMSNIFNFSHHYINTITLEELNYSIKNNKNVKIIYLIREYLLSKEKKELYKKNSDIIKNRSDYVYEQYNLQIKNLPQINEQKNNEEIQKNINTFINSIIILMIKDNKNEYIFIYKYNNTFYKIVFKVYINNKIDLIISQLNNIYKKKQSNIIFEKHNNFFEILLCKELTKEDYKNIFKYNPINLKKIYKIDNHKLEINLKEYYLSELLKNFQDLFNVDNLFNQSIHYPMLIDNYINRSTIYIQHKKNIKFNPILSSDNCNIKICENDIININNVYYDDDNSCGYNIIETFYDNRIIIWILPSNLNTPNQTHKYLGNFLYLDETSLPILEKINKLYVNNKYMCFLHIALSAQYHCLHFHIIPKKKLYERIIYPNKDRGTFTIQENYLNNIINNIKINNNYYSQLNYNILKQ